MIAIRNLAHKWGAFSMSGISLEVADGEYFVILGPCGSGKTLLLETIAGLHVPTTGQVLINGQDVTRLPAERRRVGLVYQQYALFPHLSVRDNVGYGLRYLNMTKTEQRRRVDEMLELMEIQYLGGRERPVGLSGGEAQKVALARALATEPAVLLLDEPLSSLDQRARQRVVGILESIGPRLNIPVIHVTHDYTEASSLGERIAVFRTGSIAQIGTVRDVFWRPRCRYVAEFLGMANILDGTCSPNGTCSRVQVKDLEFRAADRAAAGAVSLCIRPEEVEIRTGGDCAEGTANCFRGVVRELTDRGFAVLMKIDVGDITLRASVARRQFDALRATAGSDVTVHLPPEAIHLMAPEPDEERHAN